MISHRTSTMVMVRLLRLSLLLWAEVALVQGFEKRLSRTRQPSFVRAQQELSETCTGSTTEARANLPPVLKSIADERREFQVNLGKAMDVLKKDMQDILTKKPDFSIYHKEITIHDPSGVQIQGLEKYKSSFAFLQGFISFWFSAERSSIQFRMVYDWCRSSIRISWNAVLVPNLPIGRPLYIDAISYYQMDAPSGLIIEHKIEKLVVNNMPIEPPYGILSLLQQDSFRLGQPQGVPAGVGVGAWTLEHVS